MPCPKVVWCPAGKCGVGRARSDGFIDIIFSSEEKMSGTTRRPVQANMPMTLQTIAGRVIVFEYDDAGEMETDKSDLPIKTIHFVIMPPRTNE